MPITQSLHLLSAFRTKGSHLHVQSQCFTSGNMKLTCSSYALTVHDGSKWFHLVFGFYFDGFSSVLVIYLNELTQSLRNSPFSPSFCKWEHVEYTLFATKLHLNLSSTYYLIQNFKFLLSKTVQESFLLIAYFLKISFSTEKVTWWNLYFALQKSDLKSPHLVSASCGPTLCCIFSQLWCCSAAYFLLFSLGVDTFVKILPLLCI